MTDFDVLLVRGVARRRVAADHAVIHLTVSASGPSAADVERDVADAAGRLDAALDGHAEVLGPRVATSIRVRPNKYWHPQSGRQVQDGYVGERALRVRVDDPASAGPVLRAVFDAGDVEVGGPSWELRDDHPVHAEVRAAAAADARARAEAYASGLGIGVGSVAFVAEPGLRLPGGGGGGASAPMAFAKVARSEAADDGGDGAVVDLPSEVEVVAVVEVAFHVDR
jgi:uncharacterized protein YggE